MTELYKGEKVKIEELKPEDVFQRIEEEPGEHKIPRVAIVQKNGKSYMDNRNLDVFSFLKGGRAKSLTIPGNVEVHRLTGKYGKEKKEAYEKSKITNIGQHLGRVVTRSGADPEMFVVDKDDKMIPAFRFLPPKEKGLKCPTDKGGRVYFDGYQAEFTVIASHCHGWMFDSVYAGLKGLYDNAIKKYPDARLSLKSTYDVSLEELAQEPEEFVQFGCAPSFNVYDLTKPALDGRKVPFRMTGGHMHFEITANKKNPEDIKKMVKSLDAIMGVGGVSLFAEFDNPLRRTMYGLVGEYRTPPHGLEWRTPSNAWLMHPAIGNMYFDIARVAAAVGANNLLGYWKAEEAETIQCVQNCDVKLAQEILVRNKEMFLAIVRAAYPGQTKAAERAYEVFIEGAHSLIKDPQDIIGNWHLKGGWVAHCNNANSNWHKASMAKGKI